MTRRDIITCVGSVLLCVGVVSFSYFSYQGVMYTTPEDLLLKQQTPRPIVNVLEGITIDTLNQERPLALLKGIGERNPFERFQPKVKKPAKPLRLTLPKVAEPVKEPEPQKIEERYKYRGVVVLGDKKRYVIERERDRKTFFVNKGDKTRDFAVLETDAKKVVISDNENNIKVLKVFK